jgi:hypothetical protein
LNLPNYLIFIYALFKQTGALLLAAVGGVFIIIRKDRIITYTLGLLFLGTSLFFIADGIHIGFARWNLFLLPVMFFTAFHFIVSLRKIYRIMLVFILLISNIMLLPIHPDGIHLPNWASPTVDEAEYVYPYAEAIKWLSQEGNTKHLLVLGQYYPYMGFRFYFNKYKFYPRFTMLKLSSEGVDKARESSLLESFFAKYAALSNRTPAGRGITGPDTILYHSLNNIDLDKEVLYGETFKVVKKVTNSEHTLYILRKVH